MPQTVTLDLPDNFFRPLQRTAEATSQRVEELLINALRASLPPLDGLPDDVVENLTALETLDDERLRQAMAETVPLRMQRDLAKLLERQQRGSLTAAEREQLADLQQKADLVMLRKARAAVLLRFRGKRIPTLAELNELMVARR
jgi:DNA-binding helix-hairpin-helix protein with protein kinase domain